MRSKQQVYDALRFRNTLACGALWISRLGPLPACCYLQPGFVLADDTAKQLVGSWKLRSWVIQIIGGEATEPFGPSPKGRAVFTSDGYVTFIIVAAIRKPASN